MMGWDPWSNPSRNLETLLPSNLIENKLPGHQPCTPTRSNTNAQNHKWTVLHFPASPWSVVQTWAVPPVRSIDFPHRRRSGPLSESSWHPAGGERRRYGKMVVLLTFWAIFRHPSLLLMTWVTVFMAYICTFFTKSTIPWRVRILTPANIPKRSVEVCLVLKRKNIRKHPSFTSHVPSTHPPSPSLLQICQLHVAVLQQFS